MFIKPLISFGLISDIQYADVDDAINYRKEKIRHYRNSLNLVKQATQKWHEEIKENEFKFILQLGDIIDGKAFKDRMNTLNKVLNELSSDFKTIIPNFSIYHVWGNHELANFKRHELVDTELNSAKHLNNSISNKANYYKIDLTDDLKILCLDFYEVSVLGYDKSSIDYNDAFNILKQNKPLDNLADNMNKRFHHVNGSISRNQFNWLEEQLLELKKKNKKAIICGHIPIQFNSTTSSECLAWDFDELLELFKRNKSVVLAYLCGHDHYGGYYKCSETNIHYFTIPSVVEAPADTNSFATVKIFSNKILIEGIGLIGSYEIPY